MAQGKKYTRVILSIYAIVLEWPWVRLKLTITHAFTEFLERFKLDRDVLSLTDISIAIHSSTRGGYRQPLFTCHVVSENSK